MINHVLLSGRHKLCLFQVFDKVYLVDYLLQHQDFFMGSIPELIVHIGAGKTGSTSIQFSMKKAMDVLQERGIGYLGLMLEFAESAKGRPWSVEGAPQKYFSSKEPERTDTAVYNALKNELERLGERGIGRVIWSNEAFLTRSDRIIPLLKKIEEHGVKVQPICYVRRHDEWARSGYVQFGIKFKSYEGDLRNFADWSAAHDMAYFEHLKRWQEHFPSLEVYNFDAIDNVTMHFLNRIGGDEIEVVRANDQPSNALLTSWAVFNGQRHHTVLPGVFQNVAGRLRVLASQQRPVQPLNELMPAKHQLEEIQDTYQDDLQKVNALLADLGQPPMAFGEAKTVDVVVDNWEMQRMMLTMIMSLQQQVMDLETQLQSVKASKSGTGDG
ncbi:hypothetical protein [Shimia thalassica]|uniref:hypothetical protein n=1 Tax=Shimia thalassica TaxID=1715693 RepID=UPI002737026B|nr:hypothetical protein [Shimia thalassica]MDP2518843.1 hypothetical protein [Shimia thalassica]